MILKILIQNAIKYTWKGYVKLRSKVFKLGGSLKVIIEIEDSGVGIKQDIQQKIFNLFDNFKIKNVVNSGGSGIGLTLSKKLCDLMNYELTFKSQENVGSVFRIEINHK